MKLEINLADREEIEAAVPLLQLILDGTMTPQRAAPLPVFATSPAVAPTPTNAPEAATVFSAGNPAPSLPVVHAPVTVAPTASGAAPTANAPAVELDKTGLPWDERIHASTKSKLKSGEWKEKRGVDPALIASVTAELRAIPTGAPAPVDNPAAVFGAGAPVDNPAAVFGAGAPAPALPQAPAPTAPAGGDPTTFEQLMPRLTPAISSGQLSPLALQNACTSMGLANVVGLQQNPALVPSVWAILKQQAPGL